MIENMFNQNCTIQRPTSTNVNGILTKNFTEIGTYKCRLDGLRVANENTKTGANDWVGDRRRIYLERSANVQKNDKLSLDGDQYRVVNLANTSGMQRVEFITCEIINWK